MSADLDLRSSVNRYYSEKVRTHGPSPRGVDWNSAESQDTRFEQLLKVTDGSGPRLSVLDYGCGYGALLDFLIQKNQQTIYTGFDISDDMIAAARQRNPLAEFVNSLPENRTYDYVIASGVFNVRLNHEDATWTRYIIETLDQFNALSRRGFSFNMLTSYSDPEYMKDYLYYSPPCFFFDLCKKKYSRNVALLHDYGLYEFTILVKKL